MHVLRQTKVGFVRMAARELSCVQLMANKGERVGGSPIVFTGIFVLFSVDVVGFVLGSG